MLDQPGHVGGLGPAVVLVQAVQVVDHTVGDEDAARIAVAEGWLVLGR
jgi:hypothetical protein